MKVVERIAELRAHRARWGVVGLVPTMGYLHEGHLSLIRAARAESETVVMSLFVNPAQFGPSEDFATYPRDVPRDLELAKSAGVDIIYAPPLDEVYPDGFDTWVEVGALTRRWEGEHRPGHFRGVATVVLKLFEAVQPTRAYFGQKDFQQLLTIRKMVTDFNLPLEIVGCPTIREASGLALSSRNAYLSTEGRLRAAVLARALFKAQQMVERGETNAATVRRTIEDEIANESMARIDYLAVVDPITLEPLEWVEREARIVAAMFFEMVRLIDNVPLVPGRAAR